MWYILPDHSSKPSKDSGQGSLHGSVVATHAKPTPVTNVSLAKAKLPLKTLTIPLKPLDRSSNRKIFHVKPQQTALISRYV